MSVKSQACPRPRLRVQNSTQLSPIGGQEPSTWTITSQDPLAGSWRKQQCGLELGNPIWDGSIASGGLIGSTTPTASLSLPAPFYSISSVCQRLSPSGIVTCTLLNGLLQVLGAHDCALWWGHEFSLWLRSQGHYDAKVVSLQTGHTFQKANPALDTLSLGIMSYSKKNHVEQTQTTKRDAKCSLRLIIFFCLEWLSSRFSFCFLLWGRPHKWQVFRYKNQWHKVILRSRTPNTSSRHELPLPTGWLHGEDVTPACQSEDLKTKEKHLRDSMLWYYMIIMTV